MNPCQRCNSSRIAKVSAKCSDMFSLCTGKLNYDGYVPREMGIGGGDCVQFAYCFECGQIQGEWPKTQSTIDDLTLEMMTKNIDGLRREIRRQRDPITVREMEEELSEMEEAYEVSLMEQQEARG